MGGLLAALQTAKAQRNARSATDAAAKESEATPSPSSLSIGAGIASADPSHPEVHAPWAPEEAAASHLQLVRG